jgi:Zn-dependent alcohol dehydrogenase
VSQFEFFAQIHQEVRRQTETPPEAVLGRTPMITALTLIATRQVDVTPMISEMLPLDEVQRGFDALWSGKNIVSMVQP